MQKTGIKRLNNLRLNLYEGQAQKPEKQNHIPPFLVTN